MKNARPKRKVKDDNELLTCGREILSLEAKAIESVASILDEHFEHAVQLIAGIGPGGRVVLSGIGKAGFIAMKISATFASLGIPSFFLHPAEAIHGDLGRYTKGDIALIVSNSGETPEILRILPQIKRVGCSIISLTATSESNLGKHSDVVVAIGKIEEAGPLGLAPTTTTTAMLALGDALAMTVMHMRGFSKEQFARYHPGGSLGRALTLVSEVMREGDANCVVDQDMKAGDVLHRMSGTKGRPGAASIVNKQGQLVGIFTDGDLRRCLDQRGNFLELPIRELMGKNPKSIAPDKLIDEALRIMNEFQIDQLVVIDDKHIPVGLIDIQDVYRA